MSVCPCRHSLFDSSSSSSGPKTATSGVSAEGAAVEEDGVTLAQKKQQRSSLSGGGGGGGEVLVIPGYDPLKRDPRFALTGELFFFFCGLLSPRVVLCCVFFLRHVNASDILG